MSKYGIISVSSAEPCPFCSHTDWCYKMPADGINGYIHFCNRTPNVAKDTLVRGNDGQTYVVVGNSKSGASVFEELTQRAVRFPQKYSGIDTSNYKKTPVKQFVYENIYDPLPNAKLNKIYKDLLLLLKLERTHSDYLHSEGFTDELIRAHRICSLPEDDYYRFRHKEYKSINPWRKQVADSLARKYGDLTGVPGFYKNPKGQWTIAGPGGILLPQYDLDANIYRLRLRVDKQYFDMNWNEITKQQADELKKQDIKFHFTGKYLNFSSFRQDKEKAKDYIIRNIFDCGCSSGNNLGFYINKDNDISSIVLTEGEKKSMIGCKLYNHPFIDIPGVNSFGKLLELDNNGKCVLDYLKSYGVKTLLIGYDADKETNIAVLNCEAGLFDVLDDWGFNVGILSWNIKNGKGIDDLLVAGYSPEITFY